MRLRVILFSFLLVLGVGLCDAGERGLPAQDGVGNFGKVNDQLYRGAQPDGTAIDTLKRLGVKTIVCLRSPGKEWKAEVQEATAHGLVCTNIPLSGIRRPKMEQVRQALDAIKSLPGPVFVHCQYGCDRTGTIIACYRIQFDKWSVEEALREAERHGMSKLERGMKDFIVDFGKAVGK